jgi:hypothetical protein
MADHPVPATQAREMTKEEADAFVSAAFQAERKIKQAALRAHESWWELASALYEFHEAGYWRALGYDSLDEFLAQPDMSLSRSTFFQMTKTWRDLVVVKKLPASTLAEIEPSKVQEVTPAIMRGDVSPEDALDDAKGLSYRDVRRKYRPEEAAKHGQKPDDSVPLSAGHEPIPVKCGTCGQWYTPDAPIDSTAEEVPEGDDGGTE